MPGILRQSLDCPKMDGGYTGTKIFLRWFTYVNVSVEKPLVNTQQRRLVS